MKVPFDKQIVTDLTRILRPVICLTGYEPCVATFYGSGFLVRSDKYFYFVTARHIFTNHQKRLSDLRIPASLGSHDILPHLGGSKADIGEHNSFEDLLLIPIDVEYVEKKKLQDQFWPLSQKDCYVQLGQTALVLGFPEEEQDVDVEANSGTYCPIGLRGQVSSIDDTERMIAVSTAVEIPLKDFNQMSGGAIFTFDAVFPANISLAGVLLQGGRNANVVHALGSLCILSLISLYESKHPFETIPMTF